jgi:hypothetical protein
MMMHPVFRAMGPVVVLLLSMAGLPQQGGAQQVSLESLTATADSALAAARAGVATAELKMRLEEKEMEEQAARDRAAAAAAPATPSTTPPAPAQDPTPPRAPAPVVRPDSDSTGPNGAAVVGGAPPRSEAAPEAEAPPRGDPGPGSALEDSAGAAGASSDRLNTLLPAPVVAQAIAQAEIAADQVDAMALESATANGMPGATAAAPTVPAGALDPATAALPLTDRVGATLETGLAGAASITADWTTLFRELVERHPGLMPALLLLMTAAGATALAVGAGIRPGRRRRAAVGHESDPSTAASPRMRPDQRVPRDVAAVLASLEGRRGTPPLYGRDPRDSTTPATRRHG